MRATYILTSLVIVLLAFDKGAGLECEDPTLKVTVKTPNPEEFDEYEQYLFRGVMAYSVRKYCGSVSNEICTTAGLANTDTGNVNITEITSRFAMCVSVDGCDSNFLEEAIKESQPRFNGALVQTDDTLVFEGVPVTLTPEKTPDFPTWLIPYIIFMSLTVIAAIAIISYTVYQTKKKKGKKVASDDDSDGLSAPVYENMTYDEPTLTEL